MGAVEGSDETERDPEVDGDRSPPRPRLWGEGVLVDSKPSTGDFRFLDLGNKLEIRSLQPVLNKKLTLDAHPSNLG